MYRAKNHYYQATWSFGSELKCNKRLEQGTGARNGAIEVTTSTSNIQIHTRKESFLLLLVNSELTKQKKTMKRRCAEQRRTAIRGFLVEKLRKEDC